MKPLELYIIAFIVVLVAWASALTYHAVELDRVPAMSQEAKLPWHGDRPFSNYHMLGDEEAFKELEHLPFSNMLDGYMFCSCDQCRCANSSQKLAPVKKPTVNGCGPEWLPEEVVKHLNVFDFKSCCDNHDACYGQCGSSRKSCDLHFLQCLQKKCIMQQKEKFCQDLADIYYGTVRVAGCFAAFIPTQHECCQCQ